MPRLSEIEFDALPPEAQEALRGRMDKPGALTWQRVMGHRPAQMAGIIKLMDSFAADTVLPKRLVEVAVVTVSKLNECPHCIGRHGVRLVQEGLSAEAVDAILDPDTPLLSPVEHLVRDYAVVVTERSQFMRDKMFDELRAEFTEAQIVELTLRIGLAGFFNRFNNAMQVEIDDHHAGIAAEHALRLTGVAATGGNNAP